MGPGLLQPFKFADDAARKKSPTSSTPTPSRSTTSSTGTSPVPAGRSSSSSSRTSPTAPPASSRRSPAPRIVGEEETFSHTDLYDFQANVEGAKVAYGNVEELVKKKDAKLAEKITTQFAAVEKLVAAEVSGKASNGQPTYVDYSTIASVQKDAGETPDKNAYTDKQRKFSDAVNALSESLSKVAGTIL